MGDVDGFPGLSQAFSEGGQVKISMRCKSVSGQFGAGHSQTDHVNDYNNVKFFFFSFRKEGEKAMATDPRTHAWKIPWMEEPGRLQSMGSLGAGHD